MRFLAKRFGAQFVLTTIVGNETADSRDYDNQPEAETAPAVCLPTKNPMPAFWLPPSGRITGIVGSEIAQLEGRHRATGGNALRAAVLGANDGLVSVLSLIMGAAGANLPGHGVLITGVAGLPWPVLVPWPWASGFRSKVHVNYTKIRSEIRIEEIDRALKKSRKNWR